MSEKTNNKYDIIFSIGTLSLIMSIFYIKNNVKLFLFFTIITWICFLYSRKTLFKLLSKSLIKRIYNLNKSKTKIIQEIGELQTNKNEILDYINSNKQILETIYRYEKSIKQLKKEVIVLEARKENLNIDISQEKNINRAIQEKEATFNILSQENDQLESKKKKLIKETKSLEDKKVSIKRQVEFINKCNLNYVDKLNGFEFEKFCVELLKINGYENVKNTQESVDYGIDLIAERDNILYAIQCKRYEGKVGNDAIQEAMTGKEYYGCNISIVLTNSIFTKNAQRLAKSAGVILWDRDILLRMMERNKENNMTKIS